MPEYVHWSAGRTSPLFIQWFFLISHNGSWKNRLQMIDHIWMMWCIYIVLRLQFGPSLLKLVRIPEQPIIKALGTNPEHISRREQHSYIGISGHCYISLFFVLVPKVLLFFQDITMQYTCDILHRRTSKSTRRTNYDFHLGTILLRSRTSVVPCPQ